MDIVTFLFGITLGGAEWVLWLLLILSVISVAIMIERQVFFSSTAVDPGPFVERLNAFLVKDDFKGAQAWLSEEKSSEAQVVNAGLSKAHQGPYVAEETMLGVQLQERFRLERNLAVLGTLGNNAPFIGLFGTVLGIIKAFHDLAAAGGSGGPEVVMYGISEALVATAVGLFVAIPAVITFNYFMRKVKRVLANMETYSKLLIIHLKAESGQKEA